MKIIMVRRNICNFFNEILIVILWKINIEVAKLVIEAALFRLLLGSITGNNSSKERNKNAKAENHLHSLASNARSAHSLYCVPTHGKR